MTKRPSQDEQSSAEYLTADINETPAGLRVETSEGETYTFRRDLNTEGDVWIPDIKPPLEVIAMLEVQDYTVATEGGGCE